MFIDNKDSEDASTQGKAKNRGKRGNKWYSYREYGRAKKGIDVKALLGEVMN